MRSCEKDSKILGRSIVSESDRKHGSYFLLDRLAILNLALSSKFFIYYTFIYFIITSFHPQTPVNWFLLQPFNS